MIVEVQLLLLQCYYKSKLNLLVRAKKNAKWKTGLGGGGGGRTIFTSLLFS